MEIANKTLAKIDYLAHTKVCINIVNKIRMYFCFTERNN